MLVIMIFAVIGMFLVPNPAVASGIAFNYNGANHVKLLLSGALAPLTGFVYYQP